MFRLLRYTLFLFILGACTAHYRVSDTKQAHYELKSLKNDSIALVSVFPYKNKLDVEMKQVIAYSDSNLTKDAKDPSLGNFVCRTVEDYVRTTKNEIAGKHIIILNKGGLRNNIPKGDITRGHIFELMPFDNEIVVLKIKGEKLTECIRSMIREKKLISRNLSFTIKDNEAIGVKIWNLPFDPNEEYYIVTTDYLAMGGDNCQFFGKPVSYEATNLKLRDAIINYCETLTKNNKHIIPERTNEIRVSE